MKKLVVGMIFILSLIIVFTGCTDKNGEKVDNGKDRIIVGVTIPPEEAFINAIAKDKVDVVTMIPPGNSPANYQPTPQQMTKLSDADIYFSIEVPAEVDNILPKLDDFNKDMKIVYLSDIVGEVYPIRVFSEDEEHSHDEDEHHDEEHGHDEDEHDGEDGHNHTGMDPHIWMSPKRSKVMVETIRDELIELDPENKDFYKNNAEEYLSRLDEVDQEIKMSLEGASKQSFIVYHPSLGYFADDYGLEMVAIEESGKEASAKKLKEVIDFAKENDIKFVFYQEEFDKSQAETIAKEIDGAAISIDTLAGDYIENMRKIAEKFEEVLQ